MKVNFLDREKRIVSVEISFKDTVCFMGWTGLYSGNIADCIKPADLDQEKLVELWKKYHSKPSSKEIMKEISEGVNPISQKVFEADKEFYHFCLKGREFWQYLYEEIELFNWDEELCKRVQAVFEAMDWAYPFAQEVEIKEHKFSYLGIGEHLVCCDRLENMKSVAIQCLNENWKPQWKAAVENDVTDLGFNDWCESLCKNDAWTEILDRENGVGKKIEIDGTDYWVGQ